MHCVITIVQQPRGPHILIASCRSWTDYSLYTSFLLNIHASPLKGVVTIAVPVTRLIGRSRR